MNSRDCLFKEFTTGKVDPKCHHSIEYASNIIWELSVHMIGPRIFDQVYLVRMLYNGEVMFDCSQAFQQGHLKLESVYEGYCTMDEFIEASNSMFKVPEGEYDVICKGKSGDSVANLKQK